MFKELFQKSNYKYDYQYDWAVLGEIKEKAEEKADKKPAEKAESEQGNGRRQFEEWVQRMMPVITNIIHLIKTHKESHIREGADSVLVYTNSDF